MKKAFYALFLSTCCSVSLFGQIVINEIIPPSTIEIKNLGGSTVNISSYTLCQFPSCNQLSEIPQICGGDLMIEGGSLIAVTVTFDISANDDELAMYFTNGSFDNPGNMADYVEWGSAGHVRESVAVAAGIWTAGDFVPAFTGCASIEYDGTGDASTDWVSQDVATSPCMENTLDGCGGANCMIAGAGLSNVQCNDSGTLSDPSDDYITFSLNPTGVDLDSTYSVSVNMGTIDPINAPYGSSTAFQLQIGSAGAGDVTLTITDAIDPECTFMVVVIDPGSCSDLCVIEDAGLSFVLCNDAGTTSDATDDFIMFNLDPTGLNIGTSYTISVSSGQVMPTSADYGVLTTFDMNNGSAGNGDFTVTITDDDNDTCQLEVLISDPGTCSNVCDLTSAGLEDVTCDDNGTTINTDDFITFTLNPVGTNLGSTYSLFVSSGSVSPDTGIYGAPTFFSLDTGSAGGGDVTVTITDDDDLACDIDVTITDPGTCSEPCQLTSTGLSAVSCDNNGSSSDDSDDIITFLLNPEGISLGTMYNVTVSSGTVSPTSAAYGGNISFMLNPGSAGGGDVTLTITDDSDSTCTIDTLVIDPGTCSNGCGLTDAGLGAVSCDNNGTSSDGSDDRIIFSLDPSGVNLGILYTVSVSTGSISPDTATYGEATMFTMNSGSAGGGDVTVTITDVNNPTCTIMVLITDPGSCAMTCNLEGAGLSAITCDANGTMDEGDDIIAFSLNPTGTGLSAMYVVTVSAGSVSPDTAAYGNAMGFALNPGSAGGGDVTLTVTDIGDTSCSISVFITDPGPCSAGCSLTGPGLSNINCNDNSTVDDDTDDYISFRLNPIGSFLGTDYTVSVSSGTIIPAGGAYGSTTTFSLNNGSAGGGDITVTITDASDTTCTIDAVVMDPGSCSEPPCNVVACDISTNSETMICVDDGVTDSLIVFCQGGGIGMNAAWVVTDTGGVIQSVVVFTDTVTLTFEGQSSGICWVWAVAWDGTLSGLAPGENTDTLSGCFDFSNLIVVTKLTGAECASPTFNPALSELILLYPVPVSGLLQIDADDVTIQRVRVLDIMGRTMFRVDQTDPRSIDMGHLETGLYYVMLETNLGWNLQRVVVGRY